MSLVLFIFVGMRMRNILKHCMANRRGAHSLGLATKKFTNIHYIEQNHWFCEFTAKGINLYYLGTLVCPSWEFRNWDYVNSVNILGFGGFKLVQTDVISRNIKWLRKEIWCSKLINRKRLCFQTLTHWHIAMPSDPFQKRLSGNLKLIQQSQYVLLFGSINRLLVFII